MAENASYSDLLRPIGQKLEDLQVESFELKMEGAEFVVRGQSKRPKPQPAPEKAARGFWRMLRRQSSETTGDQVPSSEAVELRFNKEDIARMESDGRARRQSPIETPEAHMVSQILRTVGAFVDQKGGRFLSVSKNDQAITIEYDISPQGKIVDTFTIATLYDLWVRMYKKRGRSG